MTLTDVQQKFILHWGEMGSRWGINRTVAQIHALRQDFIDGTYALRSEKMIKMQQMRMLVETSAPDKAALTKLSDEILTVEKALRDKRIDHLLKVKEIAPGLIAWGQRGFGKGGGKGFGRCGKGAGHRGYDDGDL